MARFVKMWKDGLFMGWDEAAINAECSEATLAKDVYSCMSAEDALIFNSLQPGESRPVGPAGIHAIEYFREW